MMGVTSQDLFVLDCETRVAFEHCIHELECRDIPICAVETVRGGHLYLRAAGVVQNIASGTLPDLEVRGTGGYVLLPPSLHPGGSLYRFYRWDQPQPPLVDIRRIDFLLNTAGELVPLQMRQCGDRETLPLTRKTRDYLDHGATLPEGFRNVRLFSAATDMLGCGFGVAETISRLLPVATHSGLSAIEAHHILENASRRPCVPHKALRRSSSSFNEEAQPARGYSTQTRCTGKGTVGLCHAHPRDNRT